MKNHPKRWKNLNKVMLITLGLLVLFAWMDTRQIVAMKSIDAEWQGNGGIVWNTFWQIQLPAVNLLWLGVLAAVALIWYLWSKDKSEALAVFLLPATLIWFGVQDLVYYLLSPIDTFSGSMGCWANLITPVRFYSQLLGEVCPSTTAFLLSAGTGVVVAGIIFIVLRNYKPK